MIVAMNDMVNSLIRVAIVGPCSAGKSTLSPALKEAGYETRQPAQEHSFAPNMWQRLSKPDILIYLDLSYEQACARRPHIDGGPDRLEEQHRRLAHAGPAGPHLAAHRAGQPVHDPRAHRRPEGHRPAGPPPARVP